MKKCRYCNGSGKTAIWLYPSGMRFMNCMKCYGKGRK